MNLQLLCFVSSALLVLVQADPKCSKLIVDRFPKNCNELQSHLSSHSISCEDCSKITGQEIKFLEVITSKVNKVDEIIAKSLKIVHQLRNEMNHKIKTGGNPKCHVNALSEPAVQLTMNIIEKCSHNLKYQFAHVEYHKFIEALEEYKKSGNDLDARKCACTYIVPYVNTASSNYDTAIKELENCDVKKEFIQDYQKRYKKC